uniref:Uncharacterized protein n=1 Tax=mine drainage metagenome TaxID=410659 RepID=E6PER3_9ZZZZ
MIGVAAGLVVGVALGLVIGVAVGPALVPGMLPEPLDPPPPPQAARVNAIAAQAARSGWRRFIVRSPSCDSESVMGLG